MPREVLTTGQDTLVADLTFSKDSGWLVNTLLRLTPDERGPKISRSEVRAVNLATGAEKTIDGSVAKSVFSPDGTAVALLGWNDNRLYTIGWNGGDGGEKKNLAVALGCEMECRNTGQPAWSSDNHWLVFTGTGRNLAAVRSTGGSTYDLTTSQNSGAAGQFDPVWFVM